MSLATKHSAIEVHKLVPWLHFCKRVPNIVSQILSLVLYRSNPYRHTFCSGPVAPWCPRSEQGWNARWPFGSPSLNFRTRKYDVRLLRGPQLAQQLLQMPEVPGVSGQRMLRYGWPGHCLPQLRSRLSSDWRDIKITCWLQKVVISRRAWAPPYIFFKNILSPSDSELDI